MIINLHEKLKNKEITSKELVENSIKKANEKQEDLNAFTTITKPKENEEIKTQLSGIPVSIKDNISTKDILTTGSSDTLKDYKPYFDATVIEKLKASGAVIIGKNTMDELGFGGSGLISNTGIVRNPHDLTRRIGGSSSGSAAAVAAGIIPYAIASDTGDSVRKPAAYAGIVGYKPTYGMISRYGLFPFASSLDTIGIFGVSTEDVAIVCDHLKGKCDNDMTSWDSDNINLQQKLHEEVKDKKLFYIKEICKPEYYENASDELKLTLEHFNKTLNLCKNIGIQVDEISLGEALIKSIYPAYLAISSAEGTSNTANLTGISFGERAAGETIDEIIKNYRSTNFSTAIKKRLIIGSYVLKSENKDEYFLKSAKVRSLIVHKINELFKNYDAMILPANLEPAPLIEEALNKHLRCEQHLAIANFGGYPSITIPSGLINNLPIGINLTSNIKEDAKLLNIAKKLEEEINFKGVK